jgi:hypothetical protein
MSVSNYADDLGSAVHYALETTHAIAVCPFHLDLMIRIGDDAAESHAFERARRLVKTDGTTWEGHALRKEFGRQLGRAADRYCPHCALLGDPDITSSRHHHVERASVTGGAVNGTIGPVLLVDTSLCKRAVTVPNSR